MATDSYRIFGADIDLHIAEVWHMTGNPLSEMLTGHATRHVRKLKPIPIISPNLRKGPVSEHSAGAGTHALNCFLLTQESGGPCLGDDDPTARHQHRVDKHRLGERLVGFSTTLLTTFGFLLCCKIECNWSSLPTCF